MTSRFVVSGTDTGVGKTVFAAALAGALNAHYWKPIQCGFDPEGDKETVARLAGLSRDRILPELYRLRAPLSPHRAAELEGITIEPERVTPPDVPGPVVIEGAGGLMVPITRSMLQLDLYVKWDIPIILVSRTALGTINHSLLSIFALRMREAPIHGIAFVGPPNEDSERTICDIGEVRRLGRLDPVDPLQPDTLAHAFRAGFRLEDFA